METGWPGFGISPNSITLKVQEPAALQMSSCGGGSKPVVSTATMGPRLGCPAAPLRWEACPEQQSSRSSFLHRDSNPQWQQELLATGGPLLTPALAVQGQPEFLRTPDCEVEAPRSTQSHCSASQRSGAPPRASSALSSAPCVRVEAGHRDAVRRWQRPGARLGPDGVQGMWASVQLSVAASTKKWP